MKKNTTLSIDSEIIEKSKQSFINMSEVAEKALKERLNIKEVEIDYNTETCERCGRKQEKATRDNPRGMMWICPWEQWFCWQCESELNRKARQSTTATK